MNITSHLFEAFLKCPTKCYLRSLGETGSGNDYADWVRSQNESCRTDASKRLLASMPPNECAAPAPDAATLKTAKWRLAVDVELAAPFREAERQSRDPGRPGASQSEISNLKSEMPDPAQVSAGASPSQEPTAKPVLATCLHALERLPAEGRGKAAQFVPVRFVFRNKLTQDDRLLLAFDALVLSQVLEREVSLGKIIHGDDHATLPANRGRARESVADFQDPAAEQQTETTTGLTAAALSRAQPQVLKVKTSALAGEVRKRLEKIATLLSSPTPPDLVLNRHCAECEFQARCRQKAIEKDDLSLLARMTEKERKEYRSKGIFTVTQLSYTFRPHRRPKRLRDKREKYHHSLKALAIRAKKIHIVGSPELKIDGTPVYLDVEGLPDRDFYYLIGVRIGHGEAAVQHSLWADTVRDEGKIWREFLGILETVEKPVLIHYGSYETTFLKRMGDSHGRPEGSRVAKAIESAVNAISVLFAQIYFPTLANGLKDIAHCLGFKWSEAEPAGLKTIIWRNAWEESQPPRLREKLITYNAEDCQALEILMRAT